MDSLFFEFALEPHIWRSNKYHMGAPGLRLLYSLYCRLSSGVSIGIPNLVPVPDNLFPEHISLTESPVSWDDYKLVLSWFTAWANVTAWVPVTLSLLQAYDSTNNYPICLSATASLFGSQLITNIVVLVHPDFNLQRWHVFLVYVGFCLVAFLVNAVWNSILSALNKAALIWSLCGFFIISITVLACAAPNYNSARQVSVDIFINETGWPDGLAWLLGLLQGGLCLIGVDAVAHMIEEIPEPSTEGPVIMMACVAIGIATSLIFIIVLLFVSRDIDTVISSGAGPLLQILFDATNSEPGAICLLLFVPSPPHHDPVAHSNSTSFPIGCLLLGVIAIMTTCSRMVHALARSSHPSSLENALLRFPEGPTDRKQRDSGLPFSSLWTKVHPALGMPLNALALSAFAVICCGCIFLGSSSAFNALSSATVICFDISYCVPILVHCLRGRKLLPARPWSLHPVIGWTVNLVSIAYILLTTVLFLFPPSRSVTGSTMKWFPRCLDYAIAAMGVFMLISSFYWFIRGRECFMQSHVIAGMECTVATASIEPTKLEA
ncbi:Choline transporter [Penicillium mononematosum]|uniref:Choline transporter n=1 Tax=Penicillium mononematosum TaxID=268346 RepID=UPI0025493036|nr:Choline transporter [Penicillium mononematosum]KAJ6188709.1 Choline transporter [Penicillium mononematosum]